MTKAGEGPTGHHNHHHRGRARRLVLRTVAILFGLAVFVVAAGIVRILMGPVSIGMAAEQAQQILAILAGPQGSAKVGGAALSWRPQQSFVVELTDVAIAGPAGSASIPAIVIDIDLDALLVTGRLRAHGMTLESPQVVVAPLPQTPMAMPEPVAFLDLAEQHLARIGVLAREEGIEQVAVRNGALQLPRSGASGPLSFAAMDVVGSARPSGDVALTASAAVGRETWTARIGRRTDDAGSEIDLKIDGIGLAALMGTDAVSEEVVVGTSGTARFSPSGEALGASLSLFAGAGTLRIGGIDDVPLGGLELNLAWRPQTRDFAITPSPVRIDGLEIVLGGTVTPPAGSGPWRFQLTVPRARMGPPDVPGAPAEIEQATANGNFDPATLTFTFDDFLAVAPRGTMQGRGTLYVGRGGPRLTMTAELVKPTDRETFLKVWPRFVNAPARKWLVDNIQAGELVAGTLDVDLGPNDFDTDPKTKEPGNKPAQVRFAFEQAVVKMPGAIPPLADAKGSGGIDGPHLSVTVEAATLTPPGLAPAQVGPAQVAIPNLDDRPPVNEISASVSGPAATLAAIADADPLRALTLLKIDPSGLSGSVKTQLWLKGPMEDPFNPEALDWRLTADLAGVSSKKPIDGRRIADANVVVTADRAGLTVKGKAVIEGISADVDVKQSFTGGQGATSGVEFVLTDADRKAKGVDLGTLLAGPVAVTLVAHGDGSQDVSVDLTKASITLPGIGWTKGAGVEANAAFVLRPAAGGGFQVRDFEATSDGVDIAGSLDIDKAGGIVGAQLSRFALRPGDSASLTLRRGARNGYVVTLEGKRFDGRGALRALKGDGEQKKGGAKDPPIDVTARIGRLTGYNNVFLDNVELSLAATDGTITKMRLKATSSPGAGAVSLAIDPDGKVGRLVATAGDTGRVLRFVDFYKSMGGGDGRLTANLSDGAKVITDGTFVVRDFRIAEDPKLNRLMDGAGRAAQQRNPTAAAQVTAPSTSAFTKLTVGFSVTNGIMKIDEGVLRGPTSGGTAAGTIDLPRQRMSLAGTFIPIYALNNLFGRIPVIGEILGAGSDGGLFGVTFKLEGPIADPALSFNPISSLTPGIFRRIFEY